MKPQAAVFGVCAVLFVLLIVVALSGCVKDRAVTFSGSYDRDNGLQVYPVFPPPPPPVITLEK